jgi:hypothetical protein
VVIDPIALTIYMTLLCRIKTDSTFYSEFMQPAKALSAITSTTATASASIKTSGMAASALSADDISRLIRTAVVSVLGTSVTDDQPLVEAGLDSLGESHPL